LNRYIWTPLKAEVLHTDLFLKDSLKAVQFQ